MSDVIELGLDTFGDVTLDAAGQPLPQAQVLRHVVEEAVLADRVGLRFFGVGEHHRKDFAVSAPEVFAGFTDNLPFGNNVQVSKKARTSVPSRNTPKLGREKGPKSPVTRKRGRCQSPQSPPRIRVARKAP